MAVDGETRAATHAAVAEQLKREGARAFAEMRDSRGTAAQNTNDKELVDLLLGAEANLNTERTRLLEPLWAAFKAATDFCERRGDKPGIRQMREQIRAMSASANELLLEERTPLRDVSDCVSVSTEPFV